MYDIIIIEKLVCPHCRQDLHNFEFQIKDSPSKLLEKYNFPDAISCEDGKYSMEGLCDVCSSFIKGRLFIENQLTKKISYWVENCPVYFLVPNLQSSLKSAIKENKIFKEQNFEILSALKAVLVKVSNKEEISDSSLKELEKMFDFSITKEKKAVEETASSWKIVTGTKKYYVIISSQKS